MLPEIITKARERLLVRARFLGSIALWLHWIESPEVRTMATDGRHIWFCREWCEAQGARKTMGVIAHEVLHVVNKHHLRRGDRDPERWNIAADLVINRLLTKDAYELPESGLFDRAQRFTGLPVEAVYLHLEQEHPHHHQPPDGADQQNQQGTAGTNQTNTTANPDTGVGSSTAIRDKTASRTPDSGPDKITPAKHWGEVRDLTHESGKPLSSNELRQAEDDLDVVIRQAAAAAKRAGQHGNTLCETIEASLDRVDWRDRLRTLFDGTLRSDASWSRPNRRFIQHGIFLPGWQRTGAGRVAFVLRHLRLHLRPRTRYLHRQPARHHRGNRPSRDHPDPIRHGSPSGRLSRPGRNLRSDRGRRTRRHTLSTGLRLDRTKRGRRKHHHLRNRSPVLRHAGEPWTPRDLAHTDARKDHAVRHDHTRKTVNERDLTRTRDASRHRQAIACHAAS